MYKRIYDSEEIVVDYYNDGKPMIRVSQFKDYHWQDEHFVELPEEFELVVHAHWVYKNGCWFCSHCDGEMLYEIEEYGGGMFHDVNNVWPPRCPYCGAHMDEEVDE